MAYIRDLNRAISTGPWTPWYLSELLCYQGGSGAGWSVDMSGSGTGGVYSSSGDVFDRAGKNPVTLVNITDIGVGVGDEHWGYGNCWIVVSDPNDRQWLFQRHNSATNTYEDDWRIIVSPGGNFTGGSATSRATASDEILLWGVNTGNLTSIFTSYNVPGLIQIIADDAPDPVSGEYSFWCLELVASNVIRSFMMQDPIQAYTTGNTLPVTFYAYSGLGLTDGILTNAGYSPMTYVDYGGGSEQVELLVYDKYYGYPDSAGVNPYDNKEHPCPMPIISASSKTLLGYSRTLTYRAVNRNYPDTANGLQFLYAGDCMLPYWDGSTVPSPIV